MKAEWSTWDRRDSGPSDAEHTVLLLPGGMCTAMSYEELMAEPTLAEVHLVAVTLPGHGGTPPPEDLRVENYARLTSELAAHLGCDAVVGFSMAPTSRSRWSVPVGSPGRSCCWHPRSRVRTRPCSCGASIGWPESSVACPTPRC